MKNDPHVPKHTRLSVVVALAIVALLFVALLVFVTLALIYLRNLIAQPVLSSNDLSIEPRLHASMVLR